MNRYGPGSSTDITQHLALPTVQHPSQYQQLLNHQSDDYSKWTLQSNKTHHEHKRQVEINFCPEASLKPNDLHFNTAAVHFNISRNKNILHQRHFHVHV